MSTLTRTLGQEKSVLNQSLGLDFKAIGIVVCFMCFLYPVTVGGVSVNYAFVLLPVLLICLRQGIRMPSLPVGMAAAWFLCVFILGASIGLLQGAQEGLRQIISFLLFMSIFSYVLVALDERMIYAFKSSIVLMATAFSAYALITFFLAGGNILGYDAKDVVGSQRYGFVYIIAFYILLLSPMGNLAKGAVKAGLLALLVVGIMLTFSRASIVAFGASLAGYLIYNTGVAVCRLNVRAIIGILLGVLAAGAIVVVLARTFPIVFTFFDDRLLERLVTSRNPDIYHPESSEGIRFEIWRRIVFYVMEHPLQGSGYLGAWVLPDMSVGSAHNQYMDVLLRTGLIGIMMYAILLSYIALTMWRRDPELFWGFVGVLVFGMFHETFKESQGAFVLAFMLAMSEWHSRGRGNHAVQVSSR